MAGKTLNIGVTLETNNFGPWMQAASRASGSYGFVRKSLLAKEVVTEKQPPSTRDTYDVDGVLYPMYPKTEAGSLTAKAQDEWRSNSIAYKNELAYENKQHESFKSVVESSLSPTSMSKVIPILGGTKGLQKATLLQLWQALEDTHMPTTAAESSQVVSNLTDIQLEGNVYVAINRFCEAFGEFADVFEN